MIQKDEKDALWKDLKVQWASLKRGSNADEIEKGKAKERINEIQEKLNLDKTNWNQNRQQPGTHLTQTSSNPSSNALIEKILGTVLDARREMNERLLMIQQTLNRMEDKTPSS